MFVYRPVENQKKDTLISAFFNNYQTLQVFLHMHLLKVGVQS